MTLELEGFSMLSLYQILRPDLNPMYPHSMKPKPRPNLIVMLHRRLNKE
jgi:hypothetical protein